MADKILHQVTVIETDEGFRIEIKGDKDKIRAGGFGSRMMGRMFGGFGPRMGRGRGRGHGRHRHGHGHGCCHHEDETPVKEKQPTE
ncbi:MAG TPA: hypothetical protein ENJ56_09050 [Anaerolineae bacterium]|nr:hypothetical protein [Anaerolineae bacterium]